MSNLLESKAIILERFLAGSNEVDHVPQITKEDYISIFPGIVNVVLDRANPLSRVSQEKLFLKPLDLLHDQLGYIEVGNLMQQIELGKLPKDEPSETTLSNQLRYVHDQLENIQKRILGKIRDEQNPAPIHERASFEDFLVIYSERLIDVSGIKFLEAISYYFNYSDSNLFIKLANDYDLPKKVLGAFKQGPPIDVIERYDASLRTDKAHDINEISQRGPNGYSVVDVLLNQVAAIKAYNGNTNE